jgi:hypothetical protein
MKDQTLLFLMCVIVLTGVSSIRAQSMWPRRSGDSWPSIAATQPRNVEAKPGPAPAAVPVSTSAAFTHLVFARDFEPGTKDRNGNRMGGTETMRLLEHGGKLFAGIDDWMDLPYVRPATQPARTGPEVLVKETANGPWRMDVAFPGAVRMEAVFSATMVTDGAGKKLDPPVRLLIASPSAKDTVVWTRDDATGKWTQIMLAEHVRGGVRGRPRPRLQLPPQWRACRPAR